MRLNPREPVYPIPERSGYTPHFVNPDGTPGPDIGWSEGVLSDGRPWRAELWAEDGTTMLTLVFSTLGIETYQHDDLAALLTREGLVELRGGEAPGVMRLTDPSSGNVFWSVNVVVGSGDDSRIGRSVRVRRYPGC